MGTNVALEYQVVANKYEFMKALLGFCQYTPTVLLKSINLIYVHLTHLW